MKGPIREASHSIFTFVHLTFGALTTSETLCLYSHYLYKSRSLLWALCISIICAMNLLH